MREVREREVYASLASSGPSLLARPLRENGKKRRPQADCGPPGPERAQWERACHRDGQG